MLNFLPECSSTYSFIVRLTFLGTWAIIFLSIIIVTARSIYFKTKQRKFSAKSQLIKIFTALGVSIIILLVIWNIEQGTGQKICFGVTCEWSLTDSKCINYNDLDVIDIQDPSLE